MSKQKLFITCDFSVNDQQLLDFARQCALSVADLWPIPDNTRYYLTHGGCEENRKSANAAIKNVVKVQHPYGASARAAATEATKAVIMKSLDNPLQIARNSFNCASRAFGYKKQRDWEDQMIAAFKQKTSG